MSGVGLRWARSGKQQWRLGSQVAGLHRCNVRSAYLQRSVESMAVARGVLSHQRAAQVQATGWTKKGDLMPCVLRVSRREQRMLSALLGKSVSSLYCRNVDVWRLGDCVSSKRTLESSKTVREVLWIGQMNPESSNDD